MKFRSVYICYFNEKYFLGITHVFCSSICRKLIANTERCPRFESEEKILDTKDLKNMTEYKEKLIEYIINRKLMDK